MRGLLTATVLGIGLLLNNGSPRPEQEIDCTIEPRPQEVFSVEQVFHGTPPADAFESPITVEEIVAGSPADDTSLAGVNAALRELAACQNNGSLGQFFALVTDRFLYWVLTPHPSGPEFLLLGVTYGELSDIADGTPPADLTHWPSSHGFNLGDGRIAVPFDNDDDGEIDVYYVFKLMDGRWMLDEIVGTQSTVTPATEVTPIAG